MSRAIFASVVGSAIALGGCVERRLYIDSEPQGARVWLNDRDVGVTPTEVDFTWFGTYDVRLHKEGFEPLVTSAEAKAPLHEQPGIDLIAMAVPGKDVTHIHWMFTLTPSTEADAGLLQRATDLRAAETDTGELLPAPEVAPQPE